MEALLTCTLIAASSVHAREKSCPPDNPEVTISFRGTSQLNPWGTPQYYGDFEMKNQSKKSISIYTEIETDKQRNKFPTVHPLHVELQRLDHDRWVKAIKVLGDYIAPDIMSIIHPGDTWDFYVDVDSLVESPNAADPKYRLLLSDTSGCPYTSEVFTLAKPH